MDPLIEFDLARKLDHSHKRLPYRKQQQIFIAFILLGDVISIGVALLLAYFLGFHAEIDLFKMTISPAPTFYFWVGVAMVPLWVLIFWSYRLYDWENLLGGFKEYAAIFNACLTGMVIIAVIQYFNEVIWGARGWVGLSVLLIFVLVFIERFILRRVGYAVRRRGFLAKAALILGIDGEGQALGAQLIAWPAAGINVLGYLDDRVAPGEQVVGNLYVLGGLDQLDELVKKYGVAELILVSGALPRETILNLFQCYGTSPDLRLRLSSGLFDVLTTGLSIKEIGFVPLIEVNRVRLTAVEGLVKRILDVVLSALGLVILAPIFLLVAILIKLDSEGSIIYRRRGLGLNGREMVSFKFRTMYTNGDAILQANPKLLEELATTYKIKNDPRITRIGTFLRKYSLDELPQLVNVLKGEMSLVGPRMIAPPELVEYGKWGMNLLTVRPGLTGLWQVSGRSDISYAERVRLDMFYIRNYSIWLDLQLIIRTIPVVLFGKGAY